MRSRNRKSARHVVFSTPLLRHFTKNVVSETRNKRRVTLGENVWLLLLSTHLTQTCSLAKSLRSLCLLLETVCLHFLYTLGSVLADPKYTIPFPSLSASVIYFRTVYILIFFYFWPNGSPPPPPPPVGHGF